MYYTYLWLREDGTPYYVGKGKGRRSFDNTSQNVRRPICTARVLVRYWESEEKALEIEKWYISLYGRKDNGTGILRNLTDGGENPPVGWGNTNTKGMKHSEETKKKIGKASKGNKYALGNVLSKETRRKMSEWRKGKPRSEETRKKISDSIKG